MLIFAGVAGLSWRSIRHVRHAKFAYITCYFSHANNSVNYATTTQINKICSASFTKKNDGE